MNTCYPIMVIIQGVVFRSADHTIWLDKQATGMLEDGRAFRVPRWCWRELFPWKFETRQSTRAADGTQPATAEDHASP